MAHDRREKGSRSQGTMGQLPEQAREQLGHLGNRIRGSYDSMRHGMTEGYHRAEETVSSYPMSSILIAFGLGCLTGAALMGLIQPMARQETWLERCASGPLSRGLSRFRISA